MKFKRKHRLFQLLAEAEFHYQCNNNAQGALDWLAVQLQEELNVPQHQANSIIEARLAQLRSQDC